jgi:hypothetical protein
MALIIGTTPTPTWARDYGHTPGTSKPSDRKGLQPIMANKNDLDELKWLPINDLWNRDFEKRRWLLSYKV